ncbi:ABC transporter substrate-binding protein [Fimbriimonas ginsengisoli]|uniref:Putative sugar ABC transport system, periplasmic binding protein YtfQ n=1 Tax=Fimbriimonas ginsengisoli Gsoil 348 TaxID=661478 RepID=A0A068NPJ0_FIMGI|nr:ABC transporter substrate-binding protein [Fimbriimonas ginsengisoli]AIE84650.1 Putative sugar ABC transport system, periplasmic binding protein YtfQ precursor [Fimbriimonas ginsengisoli Gsoil 348]
MKRNAAVLSLLACAGALLSLVGCGDSGSTTSSNSPAPETKTGAAPKKYTVGFSQIGAESAWRTAETKSVQDEAQKRGVTLKFADGQQKQELQIQAVRSFIAQKVDVIFLAPKVETGWEPVLREAKRVNIPVILLDRGIKVSDDSLYKTLLTSDFVEEGRMAANWLAKRMNGKGNIVELQGTVGSAPANDRKQGFAEVLAKFPDMKVTRSQTGDFTIAKGKEVMEAFLKADPTIQAVYAHNDDMALGAAQAIEEAGKKPGKDIILVSIDGVHQALEAIKDGKLNCSVECNPLLGPGAFDAAEQILAGKDVPKRIVSKDQQFDESTAAQALPTRKY